MKHEIIKAQDYLFVVSNEEIKDVRPYIGRYHLEQGHILNQFPTYLTDLTECKLVIAHFPLNNAQPLEGVDLLPEIGNNVELAYWDELYERRDSARNFNGQVAGRHPDMFSEREMSSMHRGYMEGYNKAKETYKYTEEDILNALEVGYQSGLGYDDDNPNTSLAHIIHIKDGYIKSLNQPKIPIAFECDMERFWIYNNKEYIENKVPKSAIDKLLKTISKPKTITNSEGRTEWVGTYIFN
jgi:hypothetical protein